MSLKVAATYTNGTLQLDHPLPLKEHERIVVSIKPISSLVDETYGLIAWKGDLEALEYLSRSPENSGWEHE